MWRFLIPLLVLSYASAQTSIRETLSGLGPMENLHQVWSTMLRQKWADIEIKDAFAIVDEVRYPIGRWTRHSSFLS
jgi:hypothetical protein